GERREVTNFFPLTEHHSPTECTRLKIPADCRYLLFFFLYVGSWLHPVLLVASIGLVCREGEDSPGLTFQKLCECRCTVPIRSYLTQPLRLGPNLGVSMDIPMPSLLLALGGKTLLNWAAVFVQRRHMCRSFLGTFCMSLAVADTLLFLSVSAIFLLGDVRVLGLRVTRHHVCALVHMACLAYSLLHWPVLLLAGLDYWRTLP
ncbi:hypothetical protein COCON_G00063390, partial [Conger conger]